LKCFIILSENMGSTEIYRQSNLNDDMKKSSAVSNEMVAIQAAIPITNPKIQACTLASLF